MLTFNVPIISNDDNGFVLYIPILPLVLKNNILPFVPVLSSNGCWVIPVPDPLIVFIENALSDKFHPI